jgi:2-C-methyl-D-erythritol 4-phosphate cytidylyltransferase
VIWGVVLAAAGRGVRFGRPKQLIDLAGKPALAWSFDAFASMPEVDEIVVVTEPEYVAAVKALVAARAGDARVVVVPGGEDRQASVRNGLTELSDHCGGVMVHDGARPLVQAADVRRAMRVVRPGIASLLATTCSDTIKVVDADGKVTRTLDRTTLWAAQTPQLASLRDMLRALAEAERAGIRGTDEAMLLERIGIDVLAIEGSIQNFKITYQADFERAEAILRAREPLAREEEVLLVEAFVYDAVADSVRAELEDRGTIDGIDRDLPTAIVIRAFVNASRLRGFGDRLLRIAGPEAMYTTHFSHFASAQRPA